MAVLSFLLLQKTSREQLDTAEREKNELKKQINDLEGEFPSTHTRTHTHTHTHRCRPVTT